MLPDRVEMFVAGARAPNFNKNEAKLQRWKKKHYGFDFSAMHHLLTDFAEFQEEQKKEQWRSGTYPEISAVKPGQIVTGSARIADIDMQSVNEAELDRLVSDSTVEVTSSAAI